MPTITLSIEGDLCGPISVGTVGVIRALMTHLGCSLSDAEALVDRCVFDGEHVTLSVPSRAVGESLLTALSQTPAASRINTVIAD